MYGARVDRTGFWCQQKVASDVPAPRSFPVEAKRLAIKYGIDVVIDEKNHTIDFRIGTEKVQQELLEELMELFSDFEV